MSKHHDNKSKTTSYGVSTTTGTSRGTTSSKAKIGEDISSAEQELYDIAFECDVWEMREDGQTLEQLADCIIEGIKERIADYEGRVADIRNLDLDEGKEN